MAQFCGRFTELHNLCGCDTHLQAKAAQARQGAAVNKASTLHGAAVAKARAMDESLGEELARAEKDTG